MRRASKEGGGDGSWGSKHLTCCHSYITMLLLLRWYFRVNFHFVIYFKFFYSRSSRGNSNFSLKLYILLLISCKNSSSSAI